MTLQTTVRELPKHIGEDVLLKGWVNNKRSSGKIKFLIFRDGSGVVQAVIVKDQVSPEVFERFSELTLETSLIIEGTVREDKRSKTGVELDLKNIEIVHIAKDYPI